LRIVDLTRPIPNDTRLTLEEFKLHSGGPLERYRITRIETPVCLIDGGKAVSDLDPEVFLRSAVLLDFTDKIPGELIDDEDFEAAEEDAGLALREGEVAIIRTSTVSSNETVIHSPVGPILSENAAEYLEFKHVAGVGSDMSCIENLDNSALPVHSILMKNGIFLFEDLCNLDKIDQDRFQMIALPLKMSGGVSPVRVVAAVEATA
jgi:kynurenine formamidase